MRSEPLIPKWGYLIIFACIIMFFILPIWSLFKEMHFLSEDKYIRTITLFFHHLINISFSILYIFTGTCRLDAASRNKENCTSRFFNAYR